MGELSITRIKELLLYDECTGTFTRRERRGRWPKGEIVGNRLPSGYIVLSIDGKKYYAHRVAWIYSHGNWPTKNIDHINGIRDDNRIENLRDVGQSENILNLHKPNKNNISGLLGVHPHQGKFAAALRGKYLGIRDTAEEAHQLYLGAKQKLV